MGDRAGSSPVSRTKEIIIVRVIGHFLIYCVLLVDINWFEPTDFVMKLGKIFINMFLLYVIDLRLVF